MSNSLFKRAWDIFPSLQTAGALTLKYAPPAALLGGGAAGIMNLLAQMKEQQRQEQPANGTNDTLVVKIPTKTANWLGSSLHWLSQPKAGPRAAIAAAALGGVYGLDRANVGANASSDSKITASVLGDAGITMAALTGGGLLGYGVVNKALHERRKQQMQGQLDKAKQEYSGLLGRTLAGVKTASFQDPSQNFPVINGICSVLAEHGNPELVKTAENWMSYLTSSPGAVAVLAGIAAHKYIYNRQRELQALHTTGKPSPPKEIRLVSEPVQQLPDEDPTKTADLSLDSVVNLVGGEPVTAPENPEDRSRVPAAPKAIKAGPGTVQITTASGPITVEADDPAAAALLSQGAGSKLTQLMRIYQVQPEVANPTP